MKNLNVMLSEVTDEARALGIPVSRLIERDVVINRRAVARFGCCRKKSFGRFVIELSEKLLSAPEHVCRQTLAHEILHTCAGCSNHGKRWKHYAALMNARYGYEIERVSSFEKLGVPEKPANHLVVCTSCGKEFPRTRKSSLTEHPERYRCRCGGRLLLRY